MILNWMILIMMAAGLIAWILPAWNRVLPKWVALIAVITNFILCCYVYFQFTQVPTATGDWLINYDINWIPSFGIHFHVALDGLSLVLLLLTYFLGILAVLCSWNEIKERTGFYFFNLLWTLAGINGVFVAMDLFMFYFFWEVMIVPMFFLIAIWGDTNRRYAAFKFFIFTQAGGLLMLLSILALYFIHGQQTGNYTFDYFVLKNAALGASTSHWIMLGFLVAFIIKLPVVPFHNWLPDAHSEAPTAGSLILAGLLLKTGAYGIIRFVMTLFPQDAAEIAQWAMVFGVIGIIYGAMLAYSQTDLKRLIAYTSVSHMGFVILGIFTFSEMALQGVVMQMITHGISTGALFALAGMLKERLHTRDINSMGGLWSSMSAMGGIAMLFTMASLGLPMLGNFIAEFLILMASFPVNPTLTIIASVGLVFAALYSLRMVQKVFLGPSSNTTAVKDLSARELIILGSLSISIVILGLFPQPVLDSVKVVIQTFILKTPPA